VRGRPEVHVGVVLELQQVLDGVVPGERLVAHVAPRQQPSQYDAVPGPEQRAHEARDEVLVPRLDGHAHVVFRVRPARLRAAQQRTGRIEGLPLNGYPFLRGGRSGEGAQASNAGGERESVDCGA